MSSGQRTVCFIRHAQTTYNVASKAVYLGEEPHDPLNSLAYVDAPLTEEGEKQALQIKSKLETIDVDIAICSPYQRTLKTCLIAYGDRNVLVSPLCRERLCGSCDIGTPKQELVVKFPSLDFSTVSEEIWWNPGSEKFETQVGFTHWFFSPEGQVESMETLKSRAAQFYEYLLSRKENNIAVFFPFSILEKLFTLAFQPTRNIYRKWGCSDILFARYTVMCDKSKILNPSGRRGFVACICRF